MGSNAEHVPSQLQVMHHGRRKTSTYSWKVSMKSPAFMHFEMTGIASGSSRFVSCLEGSGVAATDLRREEPEAIKVRSWKETFIVCVGILSSVGE